MDRLQDISALDMQIDAVGISLDLLTYNVYIFTTIFAAYMRRFLIVKKKKYVYIQVIYSLEWGGNARLHRMSSHVASAVFSGALRMCFHVYQQLHGIMSMRISRTNSPHIDDSHVAPAKIDANYIAVNCSCILPNSCTMCHISIQESQRCK